MFYLNGNVIPVIDNKIVSGWMAAPNVHCKVDHSIFKHDPLERGKIWKMKKTHKKAMLKAFPGGTKQMNITPAFFSKSTF